MLMNVSKTKERDSGLWEEAGKELCPLSEEQDRKALQRVVRSAEHTKGWALPCLKDIYTRRCKKKARRIIKDPNHPGNSLFPLLR